MVSNFQITQNNIISGVCKAISTYYSGDIYIYKEKETQIHTPGVTVYCINYDLVRERFDRWKNIFEIIINYYPDNSPIINNRRQDMLVEAQKIADAIKYIYLPAYIKNNNNLIESSLPCKCKNIAITEMEQGFIQIATSFTVTTKQVNSNASDKMNCIELQVGYK